MTEHFRPLTPFRFRVYLIPMFVIATIKRATKTTAPAGRLLVRVR